MPSVDETLESNQTPFAAALRVGLETLDLNQVITFTKYVRLVLPLDGFVFWVKADLIAANGASAIPNTGTPNSWIANAQATSSVTQTLSNTLDAKGSLHYATDQTQIEAATQARNQVIFSSEVEIEDFNRIHENEMFIGEFEGVRFAFNQRISFYRQANLYHYRGLAILSTTETQIIDDVRAFDTRGLVVSNSMPLWLALTNSTVYPGLKGIKIPLFPSFLLPSNMPPPYAAIHIESTGTRSFSATPVTMRNGTHDQLAADRVRITLYGLRNDQALDFQDYILNYSCVTDDFGVMSMPIIRDDHEIQSELSVIAMKKTLDIEVSYYQRRVRDISRQFILSCVPSITFSDQP